MFETLFTYPRVFRRHLEGPLAEERASYLAKLVAHRAAHATVIKKARSCLHVAIELDRWPANHCFDHDEVEEMATRYAAQSRAISSHNPKKHFRATAVDFLLHLGRLQRNGTGLPHRYEAMLGEFISHQRERSWLSEVTCRSAGWQITKFLEYLEQRDMVLESIQPADIDGFYQHMALRWGRRSLSRSVSFLRVWLVFCGNRGYTQPGLAECLVPPRIYHHEALPVGPTWPSVARMLMDTDGDDARSIRDHAIILLLSVYGMRSGEVRRLRLDDIDWSRNCIRFIRSKSGCPESVPLVAHIGNAIARYLREARPRSTSRIMFLRLRAPFTPLSQGAMYHAVNSHLPAHGHLGKGRGPHGLRHACARHLLESGLSFKEVGDHLGHRNSDTTRIYAKVNLAMLRQVAFDDLGGLS